MKGLREKFRKNEGFTMVELLIVVAIIGILAAVSIPMFNNALEKARHGVDAANIRDAISLANAEAIASLDPKKEFGPASSGGKGPQTYSYVVDNTANSDNEHQAYLTPGTTGGVTAQCAKAAADLGGLQVKIYYDPTETTAGKEIKIQASWKIDTANGGHIITAGDAFTNLGNP